jgi:hypothetical protein
MEAVEHDHLTSEIDPIDIVESLAETRDWEFDRVGDDQIALAVEGQWRTYAVTLAWCGHEEMLRLICTFEIDPPEERAAPCAKRSNWPMSGSGPAVSRSGPTRS